MLWPCGVCCGRVVYVVAEWCMLWPSGVCCVRVVLVVAEWYSVRLALSFASAVPLSLVLGASLFPL